MNMKPIYFTQEGYDKILAEQKQLTEERKQAVLDLAQARSLGDLSENGFYKGAKAKLGGIDRRLREIGYQLQYGKIAEKQQTDTVTIGCSVTVTDGKAETTYVIVGDLEANPLDKKISQNSPIGKKLIGKKLGEKVTITIPAGQLQYTITQIR